MKDIREFKTDIFSLFDKGWALLTAGTKEHFNNMTVSWGALGTLWGVPAATVYVKPIRYTHEFLDASEYFTLSFFFGARHRDLMILGARSGRDVDKIALTSLTPVEVDHGMSFRESPMALVCRKMYRQDLDRTFMPASVVQRFYEPDAPHTMYIGEIAGFVENPAQ
ncbi:MAG: flavin reductase [Pyramidobacter sp.]|jgi:flavin reductase (DIM6/NTAB) family NADH-FMN oxidoreductase RutF